MHLSTVETVLEDTRWATPTRYCFNIEAAHWPSQKILSERISRSPRGRHAAQLHRSPAAANRFIRFRRAAWAGFSVHYKAEVEVHTPPHRNPPCARRR